MTINVFDLFEISTGPSSSHTVGPMHAVTLFTAALRQRQALSAMRRLEMCPCSLLPTTDVDHGTDRAVIMGLMGEWPDHIDPAQTASRMAALLDSGLLQLNGRVAVPLDQMRNVRPLDENPPYHPNAMTLVTYGEQGELRQETYYSMGGDFVVDTAQVASGQLDQNHTVLPHDFSSAEELLLLCKHHNLRVSELMLVDERIWRSETNTHESLRRIWRTMRDCVDDGLRNEGILPGGLNVQHRAACLYRNLQEIGRPNVIGSALSAMEWVSLLALVVNEENAADGHMVTTPTDGAAEIIPMVLHYYVKLNPDAQDRDVADYLLAAAAVGIPCKRNVSISSAEVGHQGEVGSACVMAVAGLAEVLGATPAQVEDTAKIGLGHNLGLTCDPAGGLVQVPCIEHNMVATVKAINTTQMALRGDGQHFISLDKVIHTMRGTGADMHDKYKETSRGGLAVNTVEC